MIRNCYQFASREDSGVDCYHKAGLRCNILRVVPPFPPRKFFNFCDSCVCSPAHLIARGFHYDVGFAQRNVACQSQPAPTICGGVKGVPYMQDFMPRGIQRCFSPVSKGMIHSGTNSRRRPGPNPPRPPPCPSSRGRGGCGAGSAEREKKTNQARMRAPPLHHIEI